MGGVGIGIPAMLLSQGNCTLSSHRNACAWQFRLCACFLRCRFHSHASTPERSTVQKAGLFNLGRGEGCLKPVVFVLEPGQLKFPLPQKLLKGVFSLRVFP